MGLMMGSPFLRGAKGRACCTYCNIVPSQIQWSFSMMKLLHPVFFDWTLWLNYTRQSHKYQSHAMQVNLVSYSKEPLLQREREVPSKHEIPQAIRDTENWGIPHFQRIVNWAKWSRQKWHSWQYKWMYVKTSQFPQDFSLRRSLLPVLSGTQHAWGMALMDRQSQGAMLPMHPVFLNWDEKRLFRTGFSPTGRVICLEETTSLVVSNVGVTVPFLCAFVKWSSCIRHIWIFYILSLRSRGFLRWTMIDSWRSTKIKCEMHCMKPAIVDFRFEERYQQSFFFLKHQRLDEEQLKMEKLAFSVSWIDVWSNLTLKCKLPRQNYGGYGRCTSRLATRPFLFRVTFCCLETLLQQAVTLEGSCVFSTKATNFTQFSILLDTTCSVKCLEQKQSCSNHQGQVRPIRQWWPKQASLTDRIERWRGEGILDWWI